MTRLIDADKLYPDCLTKNGRLAISQNQIANAPTVEYTFEEAFQKTVCEQRLYCPDYVCARDGTCANYMSQGDCIEKKVPVGYDYGDTNKRFKEEE